MSEEMTRFYRWKAVEFRKPLWALPLADTLVIHITGSSLDTHHRHI